MKTKIIDRSFYPILENTKAKAINEANYRLQECSSYYSKYFPSSYQQHLVGALGEAIAYSYFDMNNLCPRHNEIVNRPPDIFVGDIGIEVKTQRKANWAKYGRAVPTKQLQHSNYSFVLWVVLSDCLNEASVYGYSTIEDLRGAPVVDLGAGKNFQIDEKKVMPSSSLLEILYDRTQIAQLH